MKNKISEEIEICQLLSSYLGGTIEDSEKEQVEMWLQEDETHRILLEELRNEETRAARRRLVEHIDMEKEWSRFQSSISPQVIPMRRKWLEVAKYAAVILLPLLIAGYLVFQNYSVEQLADVPVQIQPGTQRAQLVLSNGKQVDLTDVDLSLKEAEEEVIIENREKTLNYVTVVKEVKTKAVVYNELLIGKGEEYQLVLSDGTKVWLNSESRLKFPVQFAQNKREVSLEGEAFFEVTKNPKAPFIVKTPQMNVEVLGTSFNVSAYEDEEMVQATLVEGKVKVSPKYGTSAEEILNPNDQAVFSKVSNEISVRQVDASMCSSWREGVFVFDEEPLEDILRKLARWYNIKVFFQSNEARSDRFSGKLPRFENCNELLEMIEKTTDVQFTIKDNRNVIVSKIK